MSALFRQRGTICCPVAKSRCATYRSTSHLRSLNRSVCTSASGVASSMSRSSRWREVRLNTPHPGCARVGRGLREESRRQARASMLASSAPVPLVEGQLAPRRSRVRPPVATVAVVAELGGTSIPAAFHFAKAGQRRSIIEPPPELGERGHAPCGPLKAQWHCQWQRPRQ
jgi:hypothetical protein